MQIFEIIVGVTSIGSFIVSVIALFKVNDVQKSIKKSNDTKQTLKNTKVENSNINQVGRDYKGE